MFKIFLPLLILFTSCSLIPQAPTPEPIQVRFIKLDTVVYEDCQDVDIGLILSDQADFEIVVTLEDIEITTTAGFDYEYVDNQVIFPPDSTVQYTTIEIIDDYSWEIDEVLMLRIVDVEGGVIGEIGQHLVTILDND